MENICLPDVIKRFRRRINQLEKLEVIMHRLKDEMASLRSVEVCLSLGTGYGEFDLRFIDICLPNLKKLIVVEKDHNCVEELKVNLNNAFGDKIEVKIYETSIEDFIENVEADQLENVDIVLAIHVLYFLSKDTRLRLFRISFERWLNPGAGMLMFVNATKDNSISRLHEFLKPRTREFHHCEMIKSEIESLGLSTTLEERFECNFELEYDRDLHVMFSFNHVMPVTDEMIKDALGVVAPGGKGRDICEVCVVHDFKKR